MAHLPAVVADMESGGSSMLTLIHIIVDLRGPSFLPRPPNHPRRLQEGSPLRPEDHRRATQDIAETSHSGAGKA